MSIEKIEQELLEIQKQISYMTGLLEDLTLTFKGTTENKNMAKNVMGIMRGMVDKNPDIAKSPMMKDILTKMSGVIK